MLFKGKYLLKKIDKYYTMTLIHNILWGEIKILDFDLDAVFIFILYSLRKNGCKIKVKFERKNKILYYIYYWFLDD